MYGCEAWKLYYKSRSKGAGLFPIHRFVMKISSDIFCSSKLTVFIELALGKMLHMHCLIRTDNAHGQILKHTCTCISVPVEAIVNISNMCLWNNCYIAIRTKNLKSLLKSLFHTCILVAL